MDKSALAYFKARRYMPIGNGHYQLGSIKKIPFLLPFYCPFFFVISFPILFCNVI